MLYTLSDIMNVPKQRLKDLGVLNVYLEIDSGYYINLKLLENTTNPFFIDAYQKIKAHFKRLFSFLYNSKSEGDFFWKAAYRLFNYPEVNELGIGLSNGLYGRGLTSPKIRTQALINAKEIIESGFVDEDIFLYVGMFSEKVGLDLISDMISNIIIDNIKEYTKHINLQCGIMQSFLINPKKNREIYYLPLEILSDMPLTKWMINIDLCIRRNEEARNYMNTFIGKEWKDKVSSEKKKSFVKALCSKSEVFEKYQEHFKNENVDIYDFNMDKIGSAILPFIIEKYFLVTASSKKSDFENILEYIVHFKHMIEYNNASMLIMGNGRLRDEKFCQKLFHVCALSYFKDGQFDISPESNAGRGPVDFKMVGKNEKVLVELKKLSSPQKFHGIDIQLPEYAKAEKISNVVYLVFDDMNDCENKTKTIENIYKKANQLQLSTKVIFIDCKPKKSASKY